MIFWVWRCPYNDRPADDEFSPLIGVGYQLHIRAGQEELKILVDTCLLERRLRKGFAVEVEIDWLGGQASEPL